MRTKETGILPVQWVLIRRGNFQKSTGSLAGEEQPLAISLLRQIGQGLNVFLRDPITLYASIPYTTSTPAPSATHTSLDLCHSPPTETPPVDLRHYGSLGRQWCPGCCSSPQAMKSTCRTQGQVQHAADTHCQEHPTGGQIDGACPHAALIDPPECISGALDRGSVLTLRPTQFR